MKTLRAQLEVKNAGVRRDNSQLEEGGRNLEEENQSMEGGNRGSLNHLNSGRAELSNLTKKGLRSCLCMNNWTKSTKLIDKIDKAYQELA